MSAAGAAAARTDVVDPDYPVTPVPADARKSFFSIAVVLLGFTVFTPTMLAGATLGPAFAFDDLVLVILAGSLVLGATRLSRAAAKRLRFRRAPGIALGTVVAGAAYGAGALVAGIV